MSRVSLFILIDQLQAYRQAVLKHTQAKEELSVSLHKHGSMYRNKYILR